MAKNKIITSEGNVQFIFGDTGKIINAHPNHIYTSFNVDTVSFMLIALPKSSGLAIMSTKAADLEFNGSTYSISQLPDVITDAFVEAGASVRFEVVSELPASGKTNTIYLVPKESGSGYDEYIWLKDDSEWELIGDTDIELDRYAQVVELTQAEYDELSPKDPKVIYIITDAAPVNLSDYARKYDDLDNIKLKKITRSAYDALSGNTDANTLYIING